jgi:hypothetical protein
MKLNNLTRCVDNRDPKLVQEVLRDMDTSRLIFCLPLSLLPFFLFFWNANQI